MQTIPRLGLGTVSDNPPEWEENVRTALSLGYRHIDTAQMYENESYVGAGIRASQVERDDVFLATKTIYPDGPDHPNEVPAAIDASLDRLGVDSVDMFYVHWPSGIYDAETVLPHYETAYNDGAIRNIGVSNFTPQLLDEARAVLDPPIAAHQVEFHPLLQQSHLLNYAQEHDHWLVAYCPLARGAVFDVPEIQAVAEKHDVTPAQVSIAWLLSKDNVVAIPKASSERHMRENLAAVDLTLDDDDIARIDGIDREQRIIDPDRGPWNW